MKKRLSLVLVAIMVVVFTVGCSSNETSDFDTSETINVVSREDGSGTRGAFVEIVGILEKDADGNEVDRTYEEAVIQNATDAVLTTVSGDEYAIGYISLGSLNDTVKAVNVGGAEATAANVQDGSYAIARPFNIAYKGELSDLGADFVSFILSSEGQAIAEEEGYVQVGEPVAYEGSGEGKLVVAGSTSVSPLMEKLSEAYRAINTGVEIEIQSTGSSAGMQSAIEGTADIGMASRELKDSELAELTGEVIAMDGIAVIVNKDNPVDDLTLDQIKSIFVGESTEWTVAE
ncbi:MAG: extracellular solute-binding protein [Tissierellia bacterium]|nr:extracellular solute-binding protein [Tissierellia bacterium]